MLISVPESDKELTLRKKSVLLNTINLFCCICAKHRIIKNIPQMLKNEQKLKKSKKSTCKYF